MKAWFSIVVFAVAAALPAQAFAEEGSWLPNLNPFKAKPKPPTSARVSDSGNWKVPSLWPSTTTTAKRSTGPSTWQKMSNGTKSFFSKTADVLNPFDDAEQTRPAVPSGRNSAFSRTTSSRSQPESSGSWFTSLWGGEEEPPRPKTVTDFLMQDRPQP